MLYVETDVVRKSLLKSGFHPRSRKVANFEALVLHEKIIFFALVFFSSPHDHKYADMGVTGCPRAARCPPVAEAVRNHSKTKIRVTF